MGVGSGSYVHPVPNWRLRNTHRKYMGKSNDEQATMTAMDVAIQNANNSCTGPSSLAPEAP